MAATGLLLPWNRLSVGMFPEPDSGPNLRFPSSPRDRIAIASYPFRDFIVGREDKPEKSRTKMQLKEFAAHMSEKFQVKKIEPWTEHFLSLEPGYLSELREAVAKCGCGIVNIAVDGEHSQYAADSAERDKSISFSKQWIDVAVAIGSPSVRTNISPAKDSPPDLERAAESLRKVAIYGASKGVVVNLENDNPVSEDPFFVANLIEKVNSEWLHGLPDFGNSLAAHEDEYAYKGVEGMFAHAYNISHVKEIEPGENGRIGHVDLARTFGIAKDHGYKGHFSIEWDSPGDPYEGTAGLIRKTVQNLG
jgi:sugar phosphate isomerase/epimerase